jgi:hypothetical protein
MAFKGATVLADFLPKPYRPKVDPLPGPAAPDADVLMKQPVAGSALGTE